MSPSESDLRAALRDGEGDGPDVDVLIAGGRARQAQRRVRLLSSAAVVAVVACVGAGAAVILNSGNNGNASAGSAVSTNPGLRDDVAASNAAGGSATGPLAGGARGALAGVACPDSQPRYLLPGGGSPGQFGSDGPLFSKPVESVVVCSYGTATQATGAHPSSPARLVLTGDQAQQLATSMQDAGKTKAVQHCPNLAAAGTHELAMIGVAADGSQVGTVTASLTDPPCDVQITNGTAVRYQWVPPGDLQKVLVALTPGTGAIGSLPNPSHKNHGSPIQS